MPEDAESDVVRGARLLMSLRARDCVLRRGERPRMQSRPFYPIVDASGKRYLVGAVCAQIQYLLRPVTRGSTVSDRR